MRKIEITIRDIRAIKDLMRAVDSLKESSHCLDGYGSNYGGKEPLIEYKESKIERNIAIASSLLGVDYDCVVDMCYDFEFANSVLADINAKSA